MGTTTCPVCNSSIDEDAASCPYCGFKLLGSTQQFKPFNLDNDVDDADQREPQKASLRVLRGPQTGVVFSLKDTPMSVGRSPKCDIFLNDMTVSREHAEIVPVEGGFEIYDKNSFNGLWVNNANVEDRKLKPGDIIQVGAFLLLYQEA